MTVQTRFCYDPILTCAPQVSKATAIDNIVTRGYNVKLVTEDNLTGTFIQKGYPNLDNVH